MKPLTVRQACRERHALDGVDAQALEHALMMTERERNNAWRKIEVLKRALEDIQELGGTAALRATSGLAEAEAPHLEDLYKL